MNMQLLMARARMNHRQAPVDRGDPYWSSVYSLLHFDSQSLADDAGAAWEAKGSLMFGDGAYGSALISRDDGPDYSIGIASGAPTLADSDDFCIECFALAERLPQSNRVMFINTFGAHTSGPYFFLQLMNDGSLNLQISSASATKWSNAAIQAGAFHHIAIARGSGVLRGFVDGASAFSQSNSTAFDFTYTRLLRDGYSSTCPAARIDDLRMTIGAARYTADFTPPTAPFPNG